MPGRYCFRGGFAILIQAVAPGNASCVLDWMSWLILRRFLVLAAIIIARAYFMQAVQDNEVQ